MLLESNSICKIINEIIQYWWDININDPFSNISSTLPDHCGLPSSMVPNNDMISIIRDWLENLSQFLDNNLTVNQLFLLNIRFWTGTMFKGMKENPLIPMVVPAGKAEVE